MIGAAERNSVGRLIRAREQRRGGGGESYGGLNYSSQIKRSEPANIIYRPVGCLFRVVIKARTRKPIIMKLTNYPLVQRLDLSPLFFLLRTHPLASPIDFPTRNPYNPYILHPPAFSLLNPPSLLPIQFPNSRGGCFSSTQLSQLYSSYSLDYPTIIIYIRIDTDPILPLYFQLGEGGGRWRETMVGEQKRDIRGGHIFKSYIPVEPRNVFSGFLIRVITINSKISILFSLLFRRRKEGRDRLISGKRGEVKESNIFI